MTSEVTVHRALASPVRAQVLELLRTSASPLAIGELADRLDLHRNTVRSHLGILEIAGLVEHDTDRPDGPGRPRSLFRSAPTGPADEQADEASGAEPSDGGDANHLLAALLAERFDSRDTEVAPLAEDAARQWARRRSTAAQPADADDGIARVLAALEQWGFTASVDDPAGDERDGAVTLWFRRCPLDAVATANPEIACAVHRGLTRGILDALERPFDLAELTPRRSAGRCTARLERRR